MTVSKQRDSRRRLGISVLALRFEPEMPTSYGHASPRQLRSFLFFFLTAAALLPRVSALSEDADFLVPITDDAGHSLWVPAQLVDPNATQPRTRVHSRSQIDIGASASGGCRLPAYFGPGVDHNVGRALGDGGIKFCVAGEILYYDNSCFVRCLDGYQKSDGTDYFHCSKNGPDVALTDATMACTEPCQLQKSADGQCVRSVSLTDENFTLAKLNSGWAVHSEPQAGLLGRIGTR